jgi:hypothetical protein
MFNPKIKHVCVLRSAQIWNQDTGHSVRPDTSGPTAASIISPARSARSKHYSRLRDCGPENEAANRWVYFLKYRYLVAYKHKQ